MLVIVVHVENSSITWREEIYMEKQVLKTKKLWNFVGVFSANPHETKLVH